MRKLKLLGIVTSQRGEMSNTYYLMKRAFDDINDSFVEKEIIVAAKLNLFPCNHYYSLHERMCVYPCLVTRNNAKDEMDVIYKGILEADMVIFAVPIYWGSHAQLMQLIIERLNAVENQNSVFKKVMVKNKICGLMILGHEDGYQHVAGHLMNFLTQLGMIFPPQAFAAWVGESNEITHNDRKRLEN